ncbi:MAG TPA: SAM-dependent methyltransferase [Polyangiaceae bacterium]|jgi:predicted methyltransferase|nr:SAM-dependent methyltransferase [Polyangiaceae bacterium]
MSLRTPLAVAPLALLLACSHAAPPAGSANAAPASSAAASAPAIEVPAYISAALNAPDRSADDRALDAGRKPDQMLAFFGIAPGMRVAEIGAGGGYTTELLARVVGPNGKVYAENSPFILQKFANVPWTARLSKPVMANVVREDRELDDPLPADVTNLDAVLIVLFYHDTVHLGADRNKMNQAVFKALKHGGVYGIVDHSAKPGDGLQDVKTFHRIDEKTVIAEVEQNGFKLDAEASFLKNPSDTRDWNDSPREAGARRGTSDRFVLRFKKP